MVSAAALPSPACGRRWPAGPDEGKHGPLPHPSLLRIDTFSRATGEGRAPPKLVLIIARDVEPKNVVSAAALPSPACGRRWPAGPDEGKHGPLPHPSLLRIDTFSRATGEGRAPPKLVLIIARDVEPKNVVSAGGSSFSRVREKVAPRGRMRGNPDRSLIRRCFASTPSPARREKEERHKARARHDA